MASFPKPETLPGGHAWAATWDLFADDTRLREAGFRIHSRPKSGPVLWERDGKVFTQGHALRVARGQGT